MPVVSTYNFQRNWLALNTKSIEDMVIATYQVKDAAQKRQAKESLAAWIRRLAEINASWKVTENDTYFEYETLLQTVALLSEQDAAQNKIKTYLRFMIEQAQAKKKAAAEKAADPYVQGFTYFAKKRALAAQNGLKWLLKHQKAQLNKLWYSAQAGRLWTYAYAVGVGLGLAGYMLMLGMRFGLHPAIFITLPLVMGFFSFQANVWVARREPTEMFFDLVSPRPETSKLPFWKKGLAWLMGASNGALLTMITCFGMWEFLAALSPFGLLGNALIVGTLGFFFFVPELSLGLKFNRKWLEEGVFYPFKGIKGDWKYKLGFSVFVVCALTALVFTAMAAISVMKMLLPAYIAVPLTVLVAVCGLPFYLDKAMTEVNNLFDRNNGLNAGEQGKSNKHTPYVTVTRTLNAMSNSIPAFLGGMALIGGPLGIALGAVTGLCGFLLSLSSGSEGKTQGYNDEVDTELTETTKALEELPEGRSKQPRLEMEQGQLIKATAHPLLFQAFHTVDEESEDLLMDGAIPFKP